MEGSHERGRKTGRQFQGAEIAKALKGKGAMMEIPGLVLIQGFIYSIMTPQMSGSESWSGYSLIKCIRCTYMYLY